MLDSLIAGKMQDDPTLLLRQTETLYTAVEILAQQARYKLPLRLHLVDALPRNPAGKVLKFVLKDDLQK